MRQMRAMREMIEMTGDEREIEETHGTRGEELCERDGRAKDEMDPPDESEGEGRYQR